MTLEFLAYHEAGHVALAYLFFPDDIEIVTLVPRGDALGGLLLDTSADDALKDEDDLRRQVPFERRIMVSMAGEIAQRRFDAASVRRVHALSDRKSAETYLSHLLEDCDGEAIRRSYRRLLKLRTEALVVEHWPAIERIARGLIRAESLTRDQISCAFHV